MTKAYENIIYEKKPPIAYITFNRPEKLNAFSEEMQLEVRDALEDAGWADNKIRVIVLRGAGRCFSTGFAAGMDIGEAGTSFDGVQWRALFSKGKGFPTGFWDVFWNNPKPLIAQVHSYCVAGGMAAACFCDLCICSEDALFGIPRVRDGGPVLSAIWPWLLGMRKARELLYTGNLIDAQEAWRLGLVNKVVPRDKLEGEVNKLAKTMSKCPAVGIEYSKKAVNMVYELMNLRLAIERAAELDAICCSASAESNPERAEFDRISREEGLKAALTWRKNKFAEEDAWFREREARSDDKR